MTLVITSAERSGNRVDRVGRKTGDRERSSEQIFQKTLEREPSGQRVSQK